jgi:phosphonate transport system substrate-binding protein
MLTFKRTAVRPPAPSGSRRREPAPRSARTRQLVFSIIPTEETTQEVNLYKPVIDALWEEHRQEDRVLHADLLFLGDRGDDRLGRHVGVHGPNSYVIANEKDPRPSRSSPPTPRLPGIFRRRGRATARC